MKIDPNISRWIMIFLIRPQSPTLPGVASVPLFFLGTRVQRTVPVAAAARMAGRSQMVARLWQDGSRSIAWVIDGEFMVIFS